MTQRFSYYEDLTVTENLDLVAGIYEMPQPRAAVTEIIARMQLSDYADGARRAFVGRLATAAGAGRLHAASAETSPAR